MSEPIRVLHVIDQLAGGGAEVSLMEYLTEAGRESRVEHAVVALNGTPETVVAAATLPMEVMIGPPGRRPRPADVSLVKKALAGFRPNLLHCTLVRSTFASSAALRGSDLPMMVSLTSVHYDVEDTTGTLKQRVGLRVSHTIHGSLLRRPRVRFHAVSQPVADKAVEVFGLDPDRITVVPRGRPDPQLRLTATREAVRHREGIPKGSPVIVNVAREHLIKNHASLLEAVASVRQDLPALKVLFVGGPSTGSEMIDQIVRDKSLGEVVFRLGHRSDVPELLHASDLFVSTSISEGLPGAMVEAMGMHLPVIAYDVPGVNNVLEDGHPGLVPFGDSKTLSDRIVEVLTDSSLRDELGAASRRRFEEAFEIGGYVRRIGDLYSALLSERRLVRDRAELG